MPATSNKIRLLIADDHTLIREGLRKIISLQHDMEVVAEASDGQIAYQRSMDARPDIVLMDINMPNVNGIEATRNIKNDSPEIGIIALTIHDDQEYVTELVKAGVSAYLLKDVGADTLIETIRSVARGEVVFPPGITQKICGEFQRMARYNPFEEPLSRRELDVLMLIARGKTNKEIGDDLYISEKTVKNHITSIFRKIQVTDRTQAALYAVKNRMVKL
jgi:DNA-binding NarL/FixJ family response regulator